MDRRIIIYVLNPLFWLIIGTAYYVNSSQDLGVDSFWTRYGMDVLALPVYLYIAQTLLVIYYKNITYRIPQRDRLIILILIGLLFEGIFPYFSQEFTSDWRDLLAYSVGLFTIYPILERSPNFLGKSIVYLKN